MTEQRVTRVGVLARLDAGEQLRTTQAGVLVRINQTVLRMTQAGALVRMSPLVVQATTVGVLIRITPAPPPDEPAERVLLVTAATLYRAPVGESLPDVTEIEYGDAWGGNWIGLGYTLEPLTFSLDTDLVRVRVEQLLSAVRIFRRQEGLVLETTLAELTAENLALALDGAITVGDTYQIIEAGGDFAMREYAWGFEGYRLSDAGDKLAVRFFVHRGVAVLRGPIRMGRATATGIPLRIEAVADTTRPAGKQLVQSHIVMAKAAD